MNGTELAPRSGPSATSQTEASTRRVSFKNDDIHGSAKIESGLPAQDNAPDEDPQVLVEEIVETSPTEHILEAQHEKRRKRVDQSSPEIGRSSSTEEEREEKVKNGGFAAHLSGLQGSPTFQTSPSTPKGATRSIPSHALPSIPEPRAVSGPEGVQPFLAPEPRYSAEGQSPQRISQQIRRHTFPVLPDDLEKNLAGSHKTSHEYGPAKNGVPSTKENLPKKFDLVQSRWVTHDSGREIVTLIQRDTKNGPDPEEIMSRWIHYTKKCVSCTEFREIVQNADGLDLEQKALALACLEEVRRHSEKRYVNGKFLYPCARQHVWRDPDRHDQTVTFVNLPYMVLWDPVKLAEDEDFCPFDKDSEKHPVRALLQYQYRLESTEDRDQKQAIKKSKSCDRPSEKIVHVPHLWAIIINKSMTITCAPMGLEYLQSESLKIVEFSETFRDAGPTVKYTDPNKTPYYFPLKSCRTWFELITKIGGVSEDEPWVKAKVFNPDSDYKLVDQRGTVVNEDNWLSIVKTATTGHDHVILILDRVNPPGSVSSPLAMPNKEPYPNSQDSQVEASRSNAKGTYSQSLNEKMIQAFARRRWKHLKEILNKEREIQALERKAAEAQEGGNDRDIELIKNKISEARQAVRSLTRKKELGLRLMAVYEKYKAQNHPADETHEQGRLETPPPSLGHLNTAPSNMPEDAPTSNQSSLSDTVQRTANSVDDIRALSRIPSDAPSTVSRATASSTSSQTNVDPNVQNGHHSASNIPPMNSQSSNSEEAMGSYARRSYPTPASSAKPQTPGTSRHLASGIPVTPALPQPSPALWPQPSFSASLSGIPTNPTNAPDSRRYSTPMILPNVAMSLFDPTSSNHAQHQLVQQYFNQSPYLGNAGFPFPITVPSLSPRNSRSIQTITKTNPLQKSSSPYYVPRRSSYIATQSQTAEPKGQLEHRRTSSIPTREAHMRLSQLRQSVSILGTADVKPIFSWHVRIPSAVYGNSVDERDRQKSIEQERHEHAENPAENDGQSMGHVLTNILDDQHVTLSSEDAFDDYGFLECKHYMELKNGSRDQLLQVILAEESETESPKEDVTDHTIELKEFGTLKRDLYIFAGDLLDCFVPNRYDAPLIKKYWGIIHRLCHLSLEEAKSCGTWEGRYKSRESHDIHHNVVQYLRHTMWDFLNLLNGLFKGIRSEEGKEAVYGLPNSLVAVFKDLMIFLMAALHATSTFCEEQAKIIVYKAANQVYERLKNAQNELFMMIHVEGDDVALAGYEAVDAEALLSKIIENLLDLCTLDEKQKRAPEEPNSFDMVEVYSEYLSSLHTRARDNASVEVYEDIKLLSEELQTIDSVLRAQFKVTTDFDELTKATSGALERRVKTRIKHRIEETLFEFQELKLKAENARFWAKQSIELRSENNNKAIFAFTTVTIIFLPLTFVTGLLGMNTKDMRNASQGQWLFWAIALPISFIILSSTLFAVYYKEWLPQPWVSRIQRIFSRGRREKRD